MQVDRCGATGEQKSGKPEALRQEKGPWRPEEVAGPQSCWQGVDPCTEAACDAPSLTSRVVTEAPLPNLVTNVDHGGPVLATTSRMPVPNFNNTKVAVVKKEEASLHCG